MVLKVSFLEITTSSSYKMRLIKVGLVLAVCFVLVSSISELSERKGKGKKPGKKPVKPTGGKKPAPGGKGSGEPSLGGKGKKTGKKTNRW